MKTSFLAAVSLALVSCSSLPESEDHAAVRRAVLDYVEAVEQARPELIERCVHADLQKFGFYRPDPGGEYSTIPMTRAQLVELAATYKGAGYVPEDAAHSVDVFEVLDKTASVKLTAFWGIDYMHLAKHDDSWQIVQIVWQSTPDGD
jgi:hypothetical protein